MRILSALAVIATLAACGISDSTPITDLTVEDWQKECDSIDQPEKTVTCTTDFGDVDVEVGGTVEECKEAASELPTFTEDCAATMGDARACGDALYADPCAVFTGTPAECTAYFACFPMDS